MLTALALRRMRRLNAATRHAIWWFALVAVVLLPILQIGAITPIASLPQRLDEPPIGHAPFVLSAFPGWVILCALAIWLGTAIAGWMRIWAGLRLLVGLRQQSRPFDEGRQARLLMWTSVRQSGRRPCLRVADLAGGACALGLWRPTILISKGLFSALDDEALDQIVMHEHAHLARFDDWSRLAQAIIASVAGLHPAVRFINHQIDLEREAACDDRVVSRTGAAKQYAACLADAAAVSIGSFETAVVPGAIGSPPPLFARIGRLLEPGRYRSPRPARAVCFVGVVLFVGVVIASKSLRPVVMFLDSRSEAAPDPVAPSLESQRQHPIATNQEVGPHGAGTVVRVGSSQAGPVIQRSPRRPPALSVARAQTDDRPAASHARTIEASEAPPLESGRLEHAYDARASADVARPPAMPAIAVTPGTNAPWSRVADAGKAIGGGAKRSGVAIGGFFARAGKAIAKTF